MKIGYILGTFSPFHIGHLSMGVQALNKKLVDEIWYVPAKQNPWKDNSVDFNIRCEMIEEAIKGRPNMHLSRIEECVESHYSYDVLKKIREEVDYYGDEMCIVTTPETKEEIPHWHNGNSILNEYEIVTVDMPIDIHSTVLRNMIANSEDPSPYISKNVYDIIRKYNLYTKDDDVTKEEVNSPTIDEVMDSFNFERVHEHMKEVNWEWAYCGVPSVTELKKSARELLEEVSQRNESTWISTGGFVAINCDGCLSLVFALEQSIT